MMKNFFWELSNYHDTDDWQENYHRVTSQASTRWKCSTVNLKEKIEPVVMK